MPGTQVTQLLGTIPNFGAKICVDGCIDCQGHFGNGHVLIKALVEAVPGTLVRDICF